MGNARAPVVGSGLVPAWICRVSKLQLWGSVMRRLLSFGRTRGARGLRLAGRRASSGRLFPWSTSDGVEVAGQPARCLSLPLVSHGELRTWSFGRRTCPARPGSAGECGDRGSDLVEAQGHGGVADRQLDPLHAGVTGRHGLLPGPQPARGEGADRAAELVGAGAEQ